MNPKERKIAIDNGLDFAEAYAAVMEGQSRGEDFFVPGINAFTEEEIRNYRERLRRVVSYLSGYLVRARAS